MRLAYALTVLSMLAVAPHSGDAAAPPGTRRAQDANLSSPSETLRSLFVAVRSRDAEALAEIYVPGPHVKVVIELQLATMSSINALNEAFAEVFPGRAPMVPFTQPSDVDQIPIPTDQVRIAGENATVFEEQPGVVPYRLKRVDGKWRLQVPSEADQVKMVRSITAAYSTERAIRAGRFETAAQAEAAWRTAQAEAISVQ